MFDIAWTEILIVATIAIIVVGPKELPGMLRAFGKTLGQVRRTAREFQSTFNDALRDAERQAGLDEVKKDIQSIDPTKDLRKGIDNAKKTLGGKVADSAKSGEDKTAGATSADADKATSDTEKATSGIDKASGAETASGLEKSAETKAADEKLAAAKREAAAFDTAKSPDPVVPLKTEADDAATTPADPTPAKPMPTAAPEPVAEPDDTPRAAAGADRR